MNKLIITAFFGLLPFLSHSQCANFQIVADKSSVCAPEIVRFQVLNPVAGSTYEWNVGNGIIYGADTLYSFYNSPSIVSPAVKITLPTGIVCNLSEDSLVTVNKIPIPELSSMNTVLCNGAVPVTFTDITPKSASRSWIIDGTNYNTADDSVVHSFIGTGSKSISLVVTDSNGCRGVKDFTDTVQIYSAPTFRIASDVKSGCAPLAVNYSLSTNSDVSPYTKKYYWSFVGHSNNTGSTENPQTRIYQNRGQYDVKLRVDVSNGCSYNVEENDYISVGDTVILDITSSDSTICSFSELDFVQHNKNLQGNLTWNFNGVLTSVLSTSDTSAKVIPSGTGNVNVLLTHNDNGCVTTKSYNQIVEIKGVKAAFGSSDNFHCEVPHTVHLTNNSDTLDASALSYEWRILQAGSQVHTSSLENPDFTFHTMPATYDVQLIATGDNGCLDTVIKSGFIYQEPILVKFKIAPRVVCPDQIFNAINSTKPSSYLAPDSFNWYFFEKDDINIDDSSDLRSPTHSYSDTGFYDIMCVGFNGIGCRDTLRMSDIIEVVEPSIDYSISDSILCSGSSFTLEGNTTPVKASFNHSWLFNHKNSTTSYSASGARTTVRPTVFGEYEAIYSHDISGGCLASDTGTVWVNGLKTEVVVDKSSGCAPLMVNPTVNIIEDVHQGETLASYSYQWSVSPFTGVMISDPTVESPTFSFDENGDYTISVVVTNAAGCTHQSSSVKVLTGVRSGLTISDDRICFGDSLSVLDKSQNGVSSVEWSVEPSVSYTVTNVDASLKKIFVEEPGLYQLRQIVSNQGICFDTTYAPFEVIQVVAAFDATDSFLQCAPIYAEFESKSSSADTLIWDFGTGSTFKTTSTSAGTIYNKNSGWTEGYDIKLIAKNSEGCSDTVLKEDYLVVAGPLPQFKMENFTGCEPLNVKFTDQSTDGAYFYMNYNDGSLLDSSKTDSSIGIHTYNIHSFTALKQSVLPSIIVYDSLGCAAIFEPEDSIVIYRKPVIKPVFANGLNLCTPFDIQFADTGDFIDVYAWTLNGAVINTDQSGSISKSTVGDYDLQLIVTNDNNCSDTMDQTFGVYEKPQVSILLEDTICFRQIAEFTGIINSSNSVDFLEWNFGEPTNPNNINTTDSSVDLAYLSGGTKNIKLISGLSNGCSDSAMATVVITDESNIDSPEINYVSFTDNYELEVVYQKSNYSKFKNYVIDDGTIATSEDDINTTVHNILFASEPTTSICYTVQVVDYCDLEGIVSPAHCFIALAAQSTNPYENELSWTPYQGWSSVSEYEIYRKDENDVFVKLASVNGSTMTYIDSGLCDQDYEYYVAATHPSETWKSNSFRVTQRPIYLSNPLSSSVRNVSVVGEDQVSIQWERSSFSEFSNYKVFKYENSFNNFISETAVTDTFIIDYDVETNVNSYIYRVVEQDRCGYENTSDKEGKSILLDGAYNDGCNLYWTAYENWENGVQHYNVEINNGGKFEFTHKNSHHDKDFIDKKFYRDLTGKYCYRVYGVSFDGDTSYSNEVCLFGDPSVDLPTAFTPNNDGLNDKFNPIARFILQGELEEVNSFKFRIYNRWGEQLYETDDVTKGWDGDYMGQNCPQGAYIYQLEAKGINNRRLYHKGTITLLR